MGWLFKNDKDWIEKGEQLFKQNLFEDAINCYDKALEYNPKNETALLNKGVALANQ